MDDMPDRDGRSSRHARLVTILTQLGILGASVGLNVIVGRYWGAETRGVLAVVLVSSTFAATSGGLGLHDVVVWAEHRTHIAHRSIDAWLRASYSLVLLAALAGAALAYLTGAGTAAMFVPILAVTTQGTRVLSSQLLAAGRTLRFDIARSLNGVLILVAVTVGAFVLDERVGPTALVAVAAITSMIPLYWIARRPVFGTAHLPPRRALRLGIASLLLGLTYTSLARADTLFVSGIVGTAEAGVYAVALAAAEGVQVAAAALSFHALSDGARGRALSLRTVSLAGGSCGALAFVAAPLIYFLQVPVLGDAFQDTFTVFAILVPGTIALAITRLLVAYDVGTGHARPALITLGAAFIVQCALDLALIPSFGLNGAAVASTTAYLLSLVILLLLNRLRSGA
jgi:O-antigen/teichoic acid export membrane protein